MIMKKHISNKHPTKNNCHNKNGLNPITASPFSPLFPPTCNFDENATFTGLAIVISTLCVTPLNVLCPSITPIPFIEISPIGTLFTGFPDTVEIFIGIIEFMGIGTLIFIPAVGVSTSRDDNMDECVEELI